jgi:hypothetical protein
MATSMGVEMKSDNLPWLLSVIVLSFLLLTGFPTVGSSDADARVAAAGEAEAASKAAADDAEDARIQAEYDAEDRAADAEDAAQEARDAADADRDSQ